jgi:hypothetical protein
MPVAITVGQTSLPSPTGSLPIGRSLLLWKDQTRPEKHGLTAGKSREIAAYVFYPATATGTKGEYYPGLAGRDAVETRFLHQQFGDVWSAVTAGTIHTNTYDFAPIIRGRAKFPVLIFSPGALAPVLDYQLQLEELASHGYVIFGLEHGTDSALLIRPDGTTLLHNNGQEEDSGPPTLAGLERNSEQVIRRTDDIVFALNQILLLSTQPDSIFQRRLDLARIGVFGHSQGGKAAIRACQIDSRVRACLNQDGEMFGIPFGSGQPVPSLVAEKTILPPVAVIFVAEPGPNDAQLDAVAVTRGQYDGWRAAKNKALRDFLRQNTRDSSLITIAAPGYVHASFMDIRLLGPNPASQDAVNHRTGTNITNAFFDSRMSYGDPKAWPRFVNAPGEGIAVERIGAKP